MAHETMTGKIYSESSRDKRFDNSTRFVSTEDYWYTYENRPSIKEGIALIENILSSGELYTIPQIVALCGRRCENDFIHKILTHCKKNVVWGFNTGNHYGLTLRKFESSHLYIRELGE